jgi:hypothetical protein
MRKPKELIEAQHKVIAAIIHPIDEKGNTSNTKARVAKKIIPGKENISDEIAMPKA